MLADQEADEELELQVEAGLEAAAQRLGRAPTGELSSEVHVRQGSWSGARQGAWRQLHSSWAGHQ